MKYIRTKDGIYKYVSKSDEFGGVWTTKIGIEHLILDKEIIKQADTIEELCDEIVWGNCLILFTNKEHTKFVIKQSPYKQDEEYDLNEDVDKEDIIYGAIWTDKGLIYVAKMNEKGELELL